MTLAPKIDVANGKETTIPVDAVVYATGWSTQLPYIAPELASELGLPAPLSAQEPKTSAHWQALEKLKDAEILSRFPLICDPPAYNKIEDPNSPFRLYKAIAPVTDFEDHSIVFLGKLTVGNNFRGSEAQALWAAAYLDGNVHLKGQAKSARPSQSLMEDEVAQTVAWGRRRYLNKGQMGSWFYFDVVSYTDMLYKQLGLISHRPKGWKKNLFEPCFARELQGLTKEYQGLYPPKV